jgi:hypothetical protein
MESPWIYQRQIFEGDDYGTLTHSQLTYLGEGHNLSAIASFLNCLNDQKIPQAWL